MSRCLPHSLADESMSARSLVQDSAAPAWLRAAARDSRRSQLEACAECLAKSPAGPMRNGGSVIGGAFDQKSPAASRGMVSSHVN